MIISFMFRLSLVLINATQLSSLLLQEFDDIEKCPQEFIEPKLKSFLYDRSKRYTEMQNSVFKKHIPLWIRTQDLAQSSSYKEPTEDLYHFLLNELSCPSNQPSWVWHIDRRLQLHIKWPWATFQEDGVLDKYQLRLLMWPTVLKTSPIFVMR